MENNHNQSSRIKKRQKYVQSACSQCKRRKVKCSGEPCCQQCLHYGALCTYTYGRVQPVNGNRQGTTTLATSSILEARIKQLQASLDEALQSARACRKRSESEAHDSESSGAVPAKANNQNDLWGTSPVPPSQTAPVASNFSSGNEQLEQSDISLDLDAYQTSSLDQAITPPNPPFPLSKTEALEFLEYFWPEVVSLYPFVPYEPMFLLAGLVSDSPTMVYDQFVGSESEDWDNVFDCRNLDVLYLLLACAIASKGGRETDVSRTMIKVVTGNHNRKLNCPKFGLKDAAIATFLSVYYLQCDDIVVAWRKIGTAVKMSQELELHKSHSNHSEWVIKMFWCIYVLDKRFSFISSHPFSLHDEDISQKAPVQDRSILLMSSLIPYLQLAAKFVPHLPKIESQSGFVDPATCQTLGIEVDKWALSTSMRFYMALEQDQLDETERNRRNQYNEAFVTTCSNHLRLSLYKHTLFSSESVLRNPYFSHGAISAASHTIHVCKNLQRSSNIYESQAVHFNYFVLSAIAGLYLGVRHAPLEFCDAFEDVVAGVEILRICCARGKASKRLSERVEALENSIRKLGYNPNGINAGFSLSQVYTGYGNYSEKFNEHHERIYVEEVSDILDTDPQSGTPNVFYSHDLPVQNSTSNVHEVQTSTLQSWGTWNA